METELPVHCEQCGGEIPAGSPDSLCPACLLTLAFDMEDEDIADVIDPSELDPSSSLGDYKLLEELGRGGMGKVYLAEHMPSGRRVALKMLSQKLHSHEMRQRFLREGRLAASINHPNSLYLYGSEEIDGHPVIIMEVAAAGTLQDRLSKKGTLPIREAVDAILDIVDGLEAAHAVGILHRDIKPSNCFVGSGGSVKIGDYGLSVSLDSSDDAFDEQREKVIGTPAYASPEQLKGNPVDVRSDIYSVGVTLFHLISGELPFDGNDAVEIVEKVLSSKPRNLRELCPDAVADLESVIQRCLDKDPGKRFRNYQNLQTALLPFSSRALEPATVVQRVAAGWIDYLIALFPAYAVLMMTVGGKALIVDPLVEPSLYSARYYFILAGVCILYFTMTESLWGSGIGKYLKGLVVADNQEFRRPKWYQAFFRAVISLGIVEVIRMSILVYLIDDYEWTGIQAVLYVLITTVCCAIPVMIAFLRGGRGVVWDRLSGTKVYQRPVGIHRPVLESVFDYGSGEGSGKKGPYEVLSVISENEWLAGFDPVLRRNVWLFRCSGEDITEARRNLARPGRLRWIQSVLDDQDVWEVYSVPDGIPFTKILDIPDTWDWSNFRYVLHDLATELYQAQADGTLPDGLTHDHIWITRDWRVKLLDRAWPSPGKPVEATPVHELEGKMEFLSRMSSGVDRSTLPIEAGKLIRNLKEGNFEKLSYLAGSLRALLKKPSVVGKPLRLAYEIIIPIYVWMAVFVGYFHDKPIEHLLNVAVPVSVIALAGFAAMQLAIQLGFRTSIGLSIFNLALVSADGSSAVRGKHTHRFMIIWGSLFIPIGIIHLMPVNALAAPSGIISGIWLVVWLAGIIYTTTHSCKSWIDSLTRSFVVRQ